MDYGLIGEKLGHSYSPQIHRLLADYSYELCPIPRESLSAFLLAKDFRGINVTIPYKKDALTYCDFLSEDAREIGCVNTIVRRSDGKLWGHNTDVAGFIAMVQSAGIEIYGRKVSVLGSGGTSLTANIALKRLGARSVVTVSRNGPIDYTALYKDHADTQVLVNTTPVGMYPNNGTAPADLSAFPRLESVVDVIYNPNKTALVLQAEKLGLKAVSGLHMLVAQARLAAECFTGASIPEDKDLFILSSIRKETLNLVLVGMPGCGKTTIGRQVAQIMHRPLLDTDALIEETAGKTIPQIFSEDGEDHFRMLETQVLQKVCAQSGAVITTGGGAVIREENRLAMQQNSIICHIERPLHALARAGRPLSSDMNALERLFANRKPLYRSVSNYTVANTQSPQETANAVLEGFYETLGH